MTPKQHTKAGWYIYSIACGLAIAAIALQPARCAPKSGDTREQVLDTCGTPPAIGQTDTSYGAKRLELDYATMLVVLEDGVVLTAIVGQK